MIPPSPDPVLDPGVDTSSMPAEASSDPFDAPVVSGEDPVDPDSTDQGLERLREDAQERGEKEDAHRSFWRELPFLIVVALVVAILIKTFLVQAFFIPSASMHETLIEGDRVMVNKLSYRFGSPSRGDVIVFDSPLQPDSEGESILSSLIRHVAESLGLSSPDDALIKRVVAVGGETIEIRQNQVFIDGAPIDEPYLNAGTRMGAFGPVTVPEGHLFVMGDNRNQSQDSRRFGTISESEVIGRAFVTVWPPSRWTGL